MKYLFEPTSLKILESLSFTNTLYAFDFDGTLAKIVMNPPDARMADETIELFEKFSSQVPTAIISGRSLSDLKSLLQYQPRHLIGNHGLEGLESKHGTLEAAETASRGWLEQLLKFQNEGGFEPGVEIENKTYSLALHYRKSRNKGKAKVTLLEAVSQLVPSPRIVMGKSVINVIPAGAPHKGMALMELMLQTGAKFAFYIGDDDTDEDIFTLPNTRIMTVRVENKQSSHAQYFIEKQSEINQLLQQLLDFQAKNKTTTIRT